LISIKGGILFGLAFFLFLWLAALNASIGLLETITANLTEKRPDMKRPVAASLSVVVILLITVFPAFSGTIFKNINILGRSVIEFFDATLINVLLPIAVLGMVILFFKAMSPSDRKKMFVSNELPTSVAMYSHWVFFLKWVVPVVISLGLLLLLLGVIFKF